MKDNLARQYKFVVIDQNKQIPAKVTILPTEQQAAAVNNGKSLHRRPNETDNTASVWVSSLFIAIIAHMVPAIWWLIPSDTSGVNTLPPAAMVVELAPVPVAPQTKLDMPPGPEQTQVIDPPKTQPVLEPEPNIPPPPPAPEPEVAMESEPKPKEPLPLQEQPELEKPEDDVPPEEESVSISSAPLEAPIQDEIAAAPQQGVSTTAINSQAISDWQNTLMLKLNEVKRYPSLARRYRQEGITYLRFSMDREGNVLAKSIEQPSGYPMLDKETLALIDRAQPLPQPAIQMAGETLEFVVPVEFFLKR